eukprot:COSAG01_NODE_16085_length_1272_cov_1.040921_2_plen_261_part_00
MGLIVNSSRPLHLRFWRAAKVTSTFYDMEATGLLFSGLNGAGSSEFGPLRLRQVQKDSEAWDTVQLRPGLVVKEVETYDGEEFGCRSTPAQELLALIDTPRRPLKLTFVDPEFDDEVCSFAPPHKPKPARLLSICLPTVTVDDAISWFSALRRTLHAERRQTLRGRARRSCWWPASNHSGGGGAGEPGVIRGEPPTRASGGHRGWGDLEPHERLPRGHAEGRSLGPRCGGEVRCPRQAVCLVLQLLHPSYRDCPRVFMYY